MKNRIIGAIAVAVLAGMVLFPTPASAAEDDSMTTTDCDGTLGDDSAPTACIIAVIPPAQSEPEPTEPADTTPPDGATTIETPATVFTPVASSDGGTVPPATPAIDSNTVEPVVAGQGGTVPSAAPTTPVTAGTTLPETGTGSSGILQIGALLLMAGAAALLAARRLHPEPTA